MSIISNLSLLAFKYFNFSPPTSSRWPTPWGFLESRFCALFFRSGFRFTFQALATRSTFIGARFLRRGILGIFLFVAFFPQFVAGPIERAGHLLPQVESPRKVSLPKFYEGCFLISWGLFEKFCRRQFGPIVDPVFDGGAPYEGWIADRAVFFRVSDFCDFDGYSNIARGLGLFGI